MHYAPSLVTNASPSLPVIKVIKGYISIQRRCRNIPVYSSVEIFTLVYYFMISNKSKFRPICMQTDLLLSSLLTKYLKVNKFKGCVVFIVNTIKQIYRFV